MTILLRSLIAAIALLAFVPGTAASQDYGRVEDAVANAPGYYFYTRPGDPVVTVTALGGLAARGQYVLSRGATIAELLALAGGATPDRSGQATVRLYRDGQPATEVDARSLYRDGATPVVLQDGDVVEVVGLVSTVPGFYVHSEPGARPLAVTAAGAFAAPGRYLLDAGVTVGDLVALAGGTGALNAREARTEITATVRLFRSGALAFEAPLEDLYARDTPPLTAGDVVDLQVVAQQRTSFWRDALSVSTAVIGLAVLIERLVN